MTALALSCLPAPPCVGHRLPAGPLAPVPTTRHCPQLAHAALPRPPILPVTGQGGASPPSGAGHVTCLGGGCACDDIVLTIAGGRIAAAERAPPLGLPRVGRRA